MHKACSPVKSCVNDKDADQTAHQHSLVGAMKLQIYMLITHTDANNRGTDQSTPSHRLKGMADADQPAHP